MKKTFRILLLLWIITLTVGCVQTNPNPNKPKTEAEVIAEVNKNLKAVDQLTIDVSFVPETDDEIDFLRILTVNDFHGALAETDGEAGAARMGKYLIDQRNLNPNETIVLSAGDMFQGTGISNYRRGLDVIKWMNAVKFDAMAIGNHEFDWGIEEILKYRDGDLTNGEADFPLLGANIFQKTNKQILPNTQAYTIINKGHLKVGIVGYIGYGLESDIAVGMVKDYKFESIPTTIAPIIEDLRKNKEVDIIIALGHDGSDTTNNMLANLTGYQAVDAIVNGHHHLNKPQTIYSADNREIPIIQAGSSGEYVGDITLNINPTTKKVTGVTSSSVRMSSSRTKHASIENYINSLIEATSPLFSRVIGIAGTDITKYPTVTWAANALRAHTETAVAFINSGGIRGDAFPISKGTEVTVAHLYKIMPFDNTVKTVTLTGAQIREILFFGLSSSSNLVAIGSSVTLNGEPLVDNYTYRVASIDYVFDQPQYPFLNGTNIEADGLLFRDVLIKAIEKLTEENQEWIP
ncbi:MAG: bifunctional UDP-sugar hydrolase/5'-nucleotidase [Bacilli bacterium]|jgi:2',3'-cyclic-nucleotide 2'-phosphodiesterase (5'-nucleotidase family)|nr:bifunctional UDP-sugar hydrolase/5'-nucleotidase [Bacilli bacterium]HHU24705.1 bifunctional metallophosphatase/5'-nucleotidase [Acholeplasmataceae bacterium]